MLVSRDMKPNGDFVWIFLLLCALASAGFLSSSVPEEYLKGQTGITRLEKTAEWASNYDPSDPVSGVIDLSTIYIWPAILAILGSVVLAWIRDHLRS